MLIIIPLPDTKKYISNKIEIQIERYRFIFALWYTDRHTESTKLKLFIDKEY